MLGAGAAMLPVGTGAIAGPFSRDDVSDHLVPADKKLAAQWVASLTERGQAEVFSGDRLTYVGMPVGGIATAFAR